MLKFLKDPSVIGPAICSFMWGAWSIWFKDFPSPWWAIAGMMALAAFIANPILAGYGRKRDADEINDLNEKLAKLSGAEVTWKKKTNYFLLLLETLKALLCSKCERYLHAVEQGAGDAAKTSEYLHVNDSLEAALNQAIECFFGFLKDEWREANEDVTLAFFAVDDDNDRLKPVAVADLSRTSTAEKWIESWDQHHFGRQGTTLASHLWREATNGRYSPCFLYDLGQAEREQKWNRLSSNRKGCAAGCAVVDRRNSKRDFLGVLIVTIGRVGALESREEEMSRFLDAISTEIMFETRKEQYRDTAWAKK